MFFSFSQFCFFLSLFSRLFLQILSMQLLNLFSSLVYSVSSVFFLRCFSALCLFYYCRFVFPAADWFSFLPYSSNNDLRPGLKHNKREPGSSPAVSMQEKRTAFLCGSSLLLFGCSGFRPFYTHGAVLFAGAASKMIQIKSSSSKSSANISATASSSVSSSTNT